MDLESSRLDVKRQVLRIHQDLRVIAGGHPHVEAGTAIAGYRDPQRRGRHPETRFGALRTMRLKGFKGDRLKDGAKGIDLQHLTVIFGNTGHLEEVDGHRVAIHGDSGVAKRLCQPVLVARRSIRAQVAQ